MNLFVKKFLGASVVFKMVVFSLLAQTAVNLGNLPLWFEANRGQVDSASQFVAHGRDSEFLISPTGANMILRKLDGGTVAAQMQFVGANTSAEISGDAEMGGKINYLIGNNSTRWQSGVPTFGRVCVKEIYSGVNVVYYGNQKRLEYDFDLAAGVNPETIAMRFNGAEKISISSQGELIVKLDGREIIQHEPVAYQMADGLRHEVKVGYKNLDAHTVAFSVGSYDRSLPLVIDPILSFATFFGGNNTDIAWAVALDSQTNIYIAGQTLSTQVSNNIPFTTSGAFQKNFQGGPTDGDAFVAKFDSFGTNLIYCTYLGGNRDDAAYAIAVDAAGHAFVTGATLSTNFPVKNAIHYQTFNGSNLSGVYDQLFKQFPSDAFVTELETNGSSLIYSTYLGGGSLEAGFGIALDSADDAFITGLTYSTNFPVTPNAYQPHFASVYNVYLGHNAFVAEIAAGGNALNYSSYLGGTNEDVGYAISFNNGYLAVAGSTCSSNFMTVNSLANGDYNGHLLNQLTSGNINNNLQTAPVVNDAFVALFQTSGSTLSAPLYSTFLGGTNDDEAYGVAVDASGNVYVVGGTISTNFPSTANVGQVALSSFVRTNTTGGTFATNSFLTQIKWNGSNPSIGYSQVFGGPGIDIARGVALDSAENIFIIGSASSLTNYSATNIFGSLTKTNSSANTGTSDVFVTAFKSDFSSLLYSAYFGGQPDDFGYGIAVDPAGNAYITGQTFSSVSFPVFNALRTVRDGANDAFLAKILLATPPLPLLTAARSGTNLFVSWPTVPMVQFTTNNLSLVTSTNLLSTNWPVATQKPVLTTNGDYTYTFNPTNRMRFFRLQAN